MVKALFQTERLYPKDFLAALRARLGLRRHKGRRIHLSREFGLRETKVKVDVAVQIRLAVSPGITTLPSS